MRQSTKSILSFAIAGVFLYFSFRKLDVREIWNSLSQASFSLLALAVALNLLHYLFRALRWKWLLLHFRTRLSLRSLISPIFAGYLVSWIFPGRLGEFVRPYLLGKREGIPIAGAFSTVVLERLFDLVTVIALFGMGILLVDVTVLDPAAGGILDRIMTKGRVAVLAGFAVLAVFWLIFRFRHRLFGRMERSAVGGNRDWYRTVLLWGKGFSEGFRVLSNPRALLAVIGHSLIVWVLIGMSMWLVLKAFHLEVTLQAAFLFLPLPVLGIAVPTPGGLGSFEYFCMWGLENLFGAPPQEALAASVGLHLVSLFPVMLLGPPSIWKEGVSLRGIRREIGEKFSAASGQRKVPQ